VFNRDGVAFTFARDQVHVCERCTVRLEFIGSIPDIDPRGEDPQPTVVSDFRGQPDRWRRGLPTFARLVYPDLWPGIDLVYRGDAERLKYEFRLQPGADPSQIHLAYHGVQSLTISSSKTLTYTPTPQPAFGNLNSFDIFVAKIDREGEYLL